MSKLVKFIASFIITIIIFNINSISYSKAYSNNNEYSISLSKDTFFISNQNKNNLKLEPIFSIEYDSRQIFMKTFLGILFTYLGLYAEGFIFLFLSGGSIPASMPSFINSEFLVYFSLLFINSFSVYIISKDEGVDYYLTLFGSILGFCMYFLFLSLEIFLESFFVEKSNNILSNSNQGILIVLFMPLVVTFVNVSLCHIISAIKEEPEEMTEEKLSKLLEEQSKSIKEFSNKVRVNGNSVSFSLVKF